MSRPFSSALRAIGLLLAVALMQGVTPPADASVGAEIPAGAERVIVALEGHRDAPRVRTALTRRGLAVERALYADRGVLVDVPDGTDAESFAASLADIPGVAYAEPDHPVAATWTGGTPDDPLFTDGTQWGPRRIQAEAAWQLARGDGMVIAIIDTGVDLTHEDLGSQLWTNGGEIPDNGIDDDDNGFIDDVLGWDFANRDAVPADDNGHGTHCAGIAGAATDNARGIAGMAPGARIMPVKVLDSRGSGSSALLAEGIDYAVDNGADVVSVSIGGPLANATLEGAVVRATEAGVLVVAAAGNEGGAILYPAAYDDALCVGATDRNDARTPYSNFGAQLDVVAPGGMPDAQVMSTVRDSLYAGKSGTSMSTPHAAGVAALLLGERPHLSPAALTNLMTLTASPRDVEPDVYYGHGLIQARDALDYLLADVTPPVSQVTTALAPPEGVRVTIGATDVGHGVDRIEWEVPGLARGTGGSVEITYPGEHIFEYHAVDLAGNREATRAIPIAVTDTLPPVTVSDARSVYYGGSATITLSATDRGIGVASTRWSLDGAPARTGALVRTSVLGDHTLAFRSVDLLGHEEATKTVGFRVYGNADVGRISGADRYTTAIQASRSAFPDESARTVVIASGRDFADALTASGLAGVFGSPILLTRPDSVPEGMLTELQRLGARAVLLVGGPVAIDQAVADTLSRAGMTVQRVAGSDRYATAAAVAERIAREMGDRPDAVFLVRGDGFADALAVAPLAYRGRRPVLLTRPDALPPVTADAIVRAGAGEVLIVGGVVAVATTVADEVSALGAGAGITQRVAGDTRYATAVTAAALARDRGWAPGPFIGVATGEDYPDALSGGAVAGAAGGVMLLTRSDALAGETRAYVADHARAGDPVRVFGGAAAVTEAAVTELRLIPLL